MPHDPVDPSDKPTAHAPIRLDWKRVLPSRWFSKSAFLILFIFSVFQLLAFERWARGTGEYVRRPESVAGILPLGHFTSFFGWLRGGGWDTLLPAGLVLILMSLAVSWVFKRGFCGWICPVGTVWEAFAALGRRLGFALRVPRWLDLIGRTFRYVLTAGAVFILLSVTIEEAVGFRELPYMWTADIRIIHLMAKPSFLILASVAAVLSVLFGPVWCRYLCPLGGLYSAVAVASPCTVERDQESCIHCRRCSKVCHARVEPEKTKRVYAPECDGCMDCVRVCPVEGCLEAKAFSKIRIAPWVWPMLVVGLWFIIFGFAVVTDNWNSKIPPDTLRQIIQSGQLEIETPGFDEGR